MLAFWCGQLADRRGKDYVERTAVVLQRHTARAFWHLASMEGPAAEAAVERESLAALLRLAAPEGKQGAQMARQALRRLCEDPAVSCAHSPSWLAYIGVARAGTAQAFRYIQTNLRPAFFVSRFCPRRHFCELPAKWRLGENVCRHTPVIIWDDMLAFNPVGGSCACTWHSMVCNLPSDL